MKDTKNTRSIAVGGAVVALALLVAAGTVMATCCPCIRSPGYWKNHPDAWPVSSLTIGGTTYTKAEAISIMRTPVAGDKRYTLFNALVAAELNVAAGCYIDSITWVINDADAWFANEDPLPGGTAVRASSVDWQGDMYSRGGENLYNLLDAYNNSALAD